MSNTVQNMTKTTNNTPTVEFPVRQISFADPLEGLTKHFAIDGNIIISHLVVHLSSVFPDGEDYFVHSVRHFRDQIKDPLLKEQVRNFIGQEAIHGREHRAMNKKFDDLGFESEKTAKRTRQILNWRTEHSSPMSNLAQTAALEHLTAVMGELFLSTDLGDYVHHEGVRSVLAWHSLEECEHKAVAFDLYRHLGGGEARRRWEMNLGGATFLTRMALLTFITVFKDPASRNLRKVWRDLKVMLSSPLFSRWTWRRIRSYNQRGFHPNQIETDDLVTQSRHSLFGPEGTLTKYLSNNHLH